ncbi:MAG: hypothetical protein AAF589_06200 [Planctomycetota bacterium]
MLSGSTACAIGPWNVPSSLPQFCGYGNGPGYHAPMIQGIPCLTPSAAQGVRYTFNPPMPSPCFDGFCGGMSTIEVLPPQPYAAPTPQYHTPHYQPTPADHPTLAPTPVYAAPGPAPLPTAPPTEPASPSDAAQPETLPLPGPAN